MNPCAATSVAHLRGVDMILPIRTDEGEGSEAVDDVAPGARAGKTLKQFLKNDAGGHDYVVTVERFLQCLHLRRCSRVIPSERKRPDAGVDEKHHFRERSAL